MSEPKSLEERCLALCKVWKERAGEYRGNAIECSRIGGSQGISNRQWSRAHELEACVKELKGEVQKQPVTTWEQMVVLLRSSAEALEKLSLAYREWGQDMTADRLELRAKMHRDNAEALEKEEQ